MLRLDHASQRDGHLNSDLHQEKEPPNQESEGRVLQEGKRGGQRFWRGSELGRLYKQAEVSVAGGGAQGEVQGDEVGIRPQSLGREEGHSQSPGLHGDSSLSGLFLLLVGLFAFLCPSTKVPFCFKALWTPQGSQLAPGARGLPRPSPGSPLLRPQLLLCPGFVPCIAGSLTPSALLTPFLPLGVPFSVSASQGEADILSSQSRPSVPTFPVLAHRTHCIKTAYFP